MTRRARLIALEVSLAAIMGLIAMVLVVSHATDWAQALPWTGPMTTILLMLLWTRKLLKRDQANRWEDSGRCANCGYDLRASVERCPECGSRILPR